jgi:hypothetical protein
VVFVIVGLGHQTGVGKDTAARALVEKLGFEHVKFANLIKSVSYLLFSASGIMPGPFYEEPGNRPLRDVPLPGVGKTPLQIWIEVGAKMREIHAPVWSDAGIGAAALLWATGRSTVFSDVRSLIEAEAIVARGGMLIKIVRSGQPVLALDELIPADWPGWHATLENNGSEGDLQREVVRVVKDWLEENSK